MFKNHNISLSLLLILGLAMPAGVAKFILPAFLASSIYDPQIVFIPIVSFQVILCFIYIIIFGLNYRFNRNESMVFSLLVFFTIAPAFISRSSAGYISYSLLHLLLPLVINIHFKKFIKSSEDALNILSTTVVLFIPIYTIDLLLGIYSFGVGGSFTSYMFASNGHTFISFLFGLILIISLSFNKVKGFNFIFQLFCFVIYVCGGLLSGGRVALFAFMISIVCISKYRYIPLFFASLVIAVIYGLNLFEIDVFDNLLFLDEKFRKFLASLFFLNFNQIEVWGSLISRLSFFDTFSSIFYDYPFAGYGGLAMNLVKYDYGFEYSAFVDPHNEIVFLLSGFGVSGLIFLYYLLYFQFVELN